MKPNASSKRAEQPAGPNVWTPARHCLVITLIGLAAIAVSIAVVRDDPAQSPATTASAGQRIAPPASPNAGAPQRERRAEAVPDKPAVSLSAEFPLLNEPAGHDVPQH